MPSAAIFLQFSRPRHHGTAVTVFSCHCLCLIAGARQTLVSIFICADNVSPRQVVASAA
jgi:hypothetical protein